ncbi:hypothetical protein EXIGLDRAFT_778402 [Exidia glandulosa HHB12029]|uniref:Uncharacterized protein n=1 Tax=Exidia glandulosa HHB12029 TaxID=1314781 RepID=A0A165CJ64_EXIGL|nr:hypothetical protein EXIGLDRAFT_778402 [Exidia glandulosa HHB12029]
MTQSPVFSEIWQLLPDVVHGYYQTWPNYLTIFRSEADVSAFVTRTVLEPCYLMINQLVSAWYKIKGFRTAVPFIELSEQRYFTGMSKDDSGGKRQMYLDHVFVIKRQAKDTIALVVEDKAAGLVDIKDLKHFDNGGRGQVLKAMTSRCENMVYHLAQKYK